MAQKSYKAPRRRGSGSRIRKMLDEMRLSNLRERREISMSSTEKKARAALQAQKPDMAIEDLEERVRKIMEHGRTPTKAEVLKPAPVTAKVLADRKAMRKAMVKNGCSRRKGGGR